MARSSRFSTRRLPDSLRSRLEVATARAWEALVDTHVAQALAFVRLLEHRTPFEDTLSRYLLETDITESMASAVKTRVLVALEKVDEAGPAEAGAESMKREAPALELRTEATSDDDGDLEDGGWRRFRPDVMVRGYRERQKREDETEGWVKLALARAEEAVIATHVDNAISFAALLDGMLDPDRAVQVYLEAVSLTGGRAQAAHQRTMARLADVHLPLPV